MINTKKVRELMEERNITARALASMTGVGESMMSYIIHGFREPNVRTLALMAKALGCTLDELVLEV